MDELDRAIVDALQDGVAVCERPFAVAGQTLGIEETALVDRLRRLLADGTLTRFGPMYDVERLGGAVTLAAMRVPPDRLDAVAAEVNAFDEVAHNYEREHALNLWFVVAAETREAIARVLAAIAARTGCEVHDLPKLEEYYIGLRLRVGERGASLDPPPKQSDSKRFGPHPGGARCASGTAPARTLPERSLDAIDRTIVVATQEGLPLVPRPYCAVASRVGLCPDEVLRRMQRMLDSGAIRRIAAVPNHYALGYRANGMSVWDVEDTQITEAGRAVGALPCVSHCYRRLRHRPAWPYNLFAMVHGRTRAEVEAHVAEIASLLGDRQRAWDVLYSRRLLKKTGVRLTPQDSPPQGSPPHGRRSEGTDRANPRSG